MKLKNILLSSFALTLSLFSLASCGENDNKPTTIPVSDQPTDVQSSGNTGNEINNDDDNNSNVFVNKYVPNITLATDEDKTDHSNIEQSLINVSNFAEYSCVQVIIEDENNESTGWGSGVIYAFENEETYYVLTNTHVVSGSNNFSIKTAYETVDAELIGYSNLYDVGFLKFTSTENYNITKFTTDVAKASYCVAVGTPLKNQFFNYNTVGNVSWYDEDSIYHTASINSGNSGGGLYNLDGVCIGLDNLKESGTTSSSGTFIEDVYHAVSTNAIVKAIKELTAPKLGITSIEISSVVSIATEFETYDLYEAYLRQYQAEPISKEKFDSYKEFVKNHPDITTGELIENVAENTNSYNLIQKGDILLKVDDIEISSILTVRSVLATKKLGDTITFEILRNNETITVLVPLNK